MSNPDKLTYINVGKKDTFTSAGNLHSSFADIDYIFQHLTDTNENKLTIHWHNDTPHIILKHVQIFNDSVI